MKSKLSGHVLSCRGTPLKSAKVEYRGKQVATTNEHGFFEAEVKANESRLPLTFSAEGYVPNTQVFKAVAAGNGNTIVVWPIVHRVRFDATQPLDIELGGTRIKIPAKSLADRRGRAYAGMAHLSFTLFDVTSPLERAAASGDFSGRLRSGRICRLNSYGIFQIDVGDLQRNPLSLRKRASAELSVALPPKLHGKAPDTIRYFDFDVQDGRWIEAGVFEFRPESMTYNGTISSFGGVHNLDDPQDTVCVNIQIVRIDDGMPIANANVTANGLQYASYGTTNTNGFVCLLVQRNAQFTVTAWADDGSSHYTTLSPTTFTSPDFSSGEDDCGNNEACPFLGTHQVFLALGIPERATPFEGRRVW